MDFTFNHFLEKYGNAVDQVLNGTFLFGEVKTQLSQETDVLGLFEHLVQNDCFDKLLPHHLDTDLHLLELLVVPPKQSPKVTQVSKKLSYHDAYAILLATLTNQTTNFTKFWSPYKKAISLKEANKLVAPLISYVSDEWDFFYIDTQHFDLKDELGAYSFFDRLDNDCCLIFTDYEQHYWVLFMSGTD